MERGGSGGRRRRSGGGRSGCGGGGFLEALPSFVGIMSLSFGRGCNNF